MSFSSEVLADAPSAYWKLGDSSGTTALDSSPNGKNGTYGDTVAKGQPALIVGDAATSVDFNGTGQIDTPSFSGGSEASVMSVEAAYLADSLGSEQAIHSRASGVRDTFRFGVTSTNRVFADFFLDGGGSIRATGSTVLSSGTVYLLGAKYDGTTATVLVNGVPDGSTTGSGFVVLRQHGSLLAGLIGAFYSGSLYARNNGRIGHVSYYRTVLTDERFMAHYIAANAISGSLAGLVPAPTAQLSGTSSPPATTATLAGLVPAPTAQLSGEVPGAPLTATLAGVVPAPTAQLTDGVVFEPFEEPRPGYGIRFGSSNVNSVKVSSVPPEELARLVPLGREAVEV